MSNNYNAEVQLPSRGLLYKDGFCNDGRVTIGMMGVPEEKLLSASRMNPSKIITTLLDRLVISPKVDSTKLLAFDRNYLLVNIRVLTFGADYKFRLKCPHCSQSSDFEVDLSQLESKPVPDDFVEPFEVELPLCRAKVSLRLFRGFDEDEVQKMAKKSESRSSGPSLGDSTYVPSIVRSIHSVRANPEEGNELSQKVTDVDEYDSVEKTMFVNNLKSRDSIFIQKTIENLKFGLDMHTFLTCPSCEADVETDIPLTETFFRPEL